MDNKDLDTDLLQKMACSNCKNIVSFGPVWINADGDTLCGRCQPNTDAAYNRLWIYEKLLSYTKSVFPCKNKSTGCHVSLTSELIKEHESICTFFVHVCPAVLKEECTWTGQIGEIQTHFNEKHQGLITKVPVQQKLDFSESFIENSYFTYRGFNFILQQKLDLNKNFISYNIAVLDSPNIAILFRYSVHFKNLFLEIIKKKPVKSYNKREIDQADSIVELLENLSSDSEKLEDTDINISVDMVTMKNCAACNRLLDQAPIYYAGEENYLCGQCKTKPDTLKKVEERSGGFIWSATGCELALGQMDVRYNPIVNRYERGVGKLGWTSGVNVSKHMFRHVEDNFKQAYLCRPANSEQGEIEWRFETGTPYKVIDKVEILFWSAKFDAGNVDIYLLGDNKRFVLQVNDNESRIFDFGGSSYLVVKAVVRDGLNYSAQLFRRSFSPDTITNLKDNWDPFHVHITFKDK